MAFNFSKIYSLNLTRRCIFHLQTRHSTAANIQNSEIQHNLQTSQNLLRDTVDLRNVNTNHSIIDNKINELCSHYQNLNEGGRNSFLIDLSTNYSSDFAAVQKTASLLSNEKAENDTKLMELTERLQSELSPRYQWLFTHIGRQKGGVKFLVDLRVDLLRLLESGGGASPHLRRLNRELRRLLLLWFSVGFLRLQRITWQSSCDMLQKVSEYEAVHPVRSWTDLKQRVAEDRRCFVYTHGSMPGEPLVVLHTALRPDIIGSVRGLMGAPWGSGAVAETHGPSPTPRAAIFYSISSTQPGLQGIELGNYMIKRVAGELLSEFPTLTGLSTLSPVPGFRRWLFDRLTERDLIFPEETRALMKLLDTDSPTDMLQELRRLLTSNAWLQIPGLSDTLRPALTRLCVRYIYLEKKAGYALCNVANFHLRNGAELWRVNWLADTGGRGLAASCGIMVNYRYRVGAGEQPDTVDHNSLAYIQRGEIAVSTKHVQPIIDQLLARH